MSITHAQLFQSFKAVDFQLVGGSKPLVLVTHKPFTKSSVSPYVSGQDKTQVTLFYSTYITKDTFLINNTFWCVTLMFLDCFLYLTAFHFSYLVFF